MRDASRYVSSICYPISLLNARGLHRKHFRSAGEREERTRECIFVARNNIVLVIHDASVSAMSLLSRWGGPRRPPGSERMISAPFWNAINKNSPDNVFESRAYVFISKPTATIPFYSPRRISWLGLYNRAGEKMYAQIYFDGCACLRLYTCPVVACLPVPALPCLGGYEFSYSTIVHVYSHRSPRLGAQWCSLFRRWNEEKGRGRRERAVSTVSKRYEAQSGNRRIARGNFPPPCWLS